LPVFSKYIDINKRRIIMTEKPEIPKEILDELAAIQEDCIPDKPFTTDGCSGGMSWAWKLIFKKSPPWEGCCVVHDFAYWQGGSKNSKYQADVKLMKCVWNNGYRFWAVMMFVAVSFYGVSWLPTSFRWGYGWKYPHACKHDSRLDK
jgi:hypothetical protein